MLAWILGFVGLVYVYYKLLCVEREYHLNGSSFHSHPHCVNKHCFAIYMYPSIDLYLYHLPHQTIFIVD